MKPTGVMRRIDDLGRIVIPKEIRKNLKIREGDSLEIFVADQGKVVLEKHSPLKDLEAIAGNYVNAINKTLNKTIIVTDSENIIAVAGEQKKDLLGKKISEELEFYLETKKPQQVEDKLLRLTDSCSLNMNMYMNVILDYGDLMGSVIVLSKKQIDHKDKDHIDTAVNFLTEYISS